MKRSAEELHFSTCQNDNCEREYCVYRREAEWRVSQLRAKLVNWERTSEESRKVIKGLVNHEILQGVGEGLRCEVEDLFYAYERSREALAEFNANSISLIEATYDQMKGVRDER